MSLKINGTEDLNFKLNGVEGIEAKLNGNVVWTKEILIPFTRCPFPTNWSSFLQNYNRYGAANSYGSWEILSTTYSGANRVNCAFDGNSATYWESGAVSANLPFYLTLTIPETILIKPSTIFCKYLRAGGSALQNRASIQGYNPDTNSWETLCTLTSSSSVNTSTFDISTETYYSKFCLQNYRFTSSTNTCIYEIQIPTGTIKMV